jgi:ABC-2 type transport system ATP-binding protein
MPAVIEIDGLAKDYPVGFWIKRPIRVLHPLTLCVKAGEIFGFLGPNGAGKTTTLKLLMRVVHPTSGTARILGLPLGHPAIYQQVGYLPEQPYFYDYLTADELLGYLGRLFGMNTAQINVRVPQLLEMVGLSPVRKMPLRKYSKGMLQRIGIAQSILNEPQVLFLDEPFSGLDPIGRRELRDIVRQLNHQGVTIFFSSHILADVESLCDRFAILHGGRLLDSGKLEEALNRESRELEVIATGVPAEAQENLRNLVSDLAVLGDRLKLRVGKEKGIVPLTQAIERSGGRILAVSEVRPSLEDLFVRQIERGSAEKPASSRSL